ncbi:hypothetical protein MWJ95_14880 [Lysinibacillus sp. Bpr_S20]|nr:hypothetical protein [Lysinibacillus sp. Bpr_S20]MCL1701702.1 hypothetical protein [Lysinibacillus sp. Bpr_S20]
MEHIKNKPKKIKKDFSPKDAVFVFSSFTFVCVAVIFVLIVYDVFTVQNFLSFDQPSRMIGSVVLAAFGLLLFGVILTLLIPSKYIDETNNSYQNYSLLGIIAFMLIGALFEEILFRGASCIARKRVDGHYNHNLIVLRDAYSILQKTYYVNKYYHSKCNFRMDLF